MLNFMKFFLKIIVIQSLILLQGCGLLIVPLEYYYMSGDGTKDVSDDFKRGHVVGKQYELVHDVYLIQYCDDDELRLERFLTFTPTSYSKIEIIPKGIRFKVCTVLAKTSFGSELCCQNILANLIDEQGNSMPKTNSSGKIVSLHVTDLFNDTFQMPLQDWTFMPISKFIKEIE